MIGKRPLVLGIDVGTSSVKMVLAPVDGGAVGRPLRTSRVPFRVSRPCPGWSEMDPRRWWRAICLAARSLDLTDECVVGIGLSTLFPALVAMDRRGRPLRPAILYDDARSAVVLRAAARRLPDPDDHRARTGNALHPGTVSLSSLLWLARHEPHTVRRAAMWGHAGTWLGYRLTGRFAIDASNASLTGLWAPFGVGVAGSGGWQADIISAAGLSCAAWPDVLYPPQRLGALAPRAAAALGLRAGTAVAAGAGDVVCAVFALGLADETDVAAACGSTDCLAILRRRPVFPAETVNMAYLDGSTWLSVAPMNTAGAAVDWFVEAFLGRGAYERFFALAAQAPPASGGVVFLPYLAGERSPVFDPAARGVFFGLSRQTGPAHMARAVLEGIGFGHRQILDVLERLRRRPVKRVIAAGGGATDTLWRQVRADAAGRTYLFSDCAGASALGAAMLGAVAAGLIESWQSAAACARQTQTFQEVRPDRRTCGQLRPNFEVYRRLYGRLAECFGCRFSTARRR